MSDILILRKCSNAVFLHIKVQDLVAISRCPLHISTDYHCRINWVKTVVLLHSVGVSVHCSVVQDEWGSCFLFFSFRSHVD